MTIVDADNDILSIIPYQELLGNYDDDTGCCAERQIIPYQELLGNYDGAGRLSA